MREKKGGERKKKRVEREAKVSEEQFRDPNREQYVQKEKYKQTNTNIELLCSLKNIKLF